MLLIHGIHDACCFMACKLLGNVWFSKPCTKFLLWRSANEILKLFDDGYIFSDFWEKEQLWTHHQHIDWGLMTHMRQWIRSMVQLMTSVYSVSSHYVNHYLSIVHLANMNKLQWYLNRNALICISEYSYSLVVCKNAAIISRSQYVNQPFWCWNCNIAV